MLFLGLVRDASQDLILVTIIITRSSFICKDFFEKISL
uniref:Uncharacterized protein n=1 Tax=Alsidium seaforthii TaxID=2007182 RepID=A0A1Z1MCN8_9FLOR|nr:hypothetical protein [Bryothamnion seaforthii]ARW63857.1 hypothetical protein [Bryothamnion seaforthii]